MKKQLWYVETTLYDASGEMICEPGCVVVEASNLKEATQKAKRLSLENYKQAADAEWGTAEEVGQPELEALKEILGDELIFEDGLFGDEAGDCGEAICEV
jgi:hypothetical protein